MPIDHQTTLTPRSEGRGRGAKREGGGKRDRVDRKGRDDRVISGH